MILAKTLDDATSTFLQENKSPSRKTGELDNRGSHFYLGMYWAQELAKQTSNSDLSAEFTPLAESLTSNEAKIIEELSAVQGPAQNTDGYYLANDKALEAIMRPSATINAIIG